MTKWLLPESLADILPAEARRIEELRRKLLDLYRVYGFELVMPPLVEYLDSLLTGHGHDLSLRTCKLVDQLSGRTLGVRADMTPQVARIDAHLLNREGVTRLCYCGSVLHARPLGLFSDRELLQIGAEIFGHAGVEADIQIIELALESVRAAGVKSPRLDLNHPGVLRAIIASDPALEEVAEEVADLLATKDIPGLQALAQAAGTLRPGSAEALVELAGLYGGPEVLQKARDVLPRLPAVSQALDDLERVAGFLSAYDLSFDFADVRAGYGYHSGIVFAVYADGWRDTLVRGGRYDGVGKAFGRARPAVGFSMDLRALASGLEPARPAKAVRAPWGCEPALGAALRELREQGHIVVQVLPGQQQSLDEFVFDRELVQEGNEWKVRAID